MGLQSSNKVDPNFNMSSLTDIIFLLLIFFLLTSTFITPNALNLTLPSSTGKAVAKQTVSVSITRDIEYYIDKSPVQLENIQALLEEKLGGEEEPTVVLNAEKGVPIEKVVDIMSIANDMKIKMILATEPEE